MAERNSSLLELRDLFNPVAPSEGTVISTNPAGSTANVATQRGVVAATLPDAVTVAAGDLVRLEGSTIVARVRGVEGLPVYNL